MDSKHFAYSDRAWRAALIEEGEEQARQILGDPEADIYWMRWRGNTRFRRLARGGDIVVEIVRHKRKATVARPRAILCRQDQPRWTRFYLEQPSDLLYWTEFEMRVKALDLKAQIRRSSVRELDTRDFESIDGIFPIR